MPLDDLLPMLPLEGPPLPRFLGITWDMEGVAILTAAVSLALSLIIAAKPPSAGGPALGAALRRQPWQK